MYSNAIEPIGSTLQPLLTSDATAFLHSRHTAEGIHETAKSLVAAGLSVIPIRVDGTKAPAVNSWKIFQSRQPFQQEIEGWFGKSELGIAVVCGTISSNLEVLDFDEDAATVFPLWCDLVKSASPGLIERLPIVETPTGGKHVYARCSTIEGNLKLARSVSEVLEGTDGARKLDNKWIKTGTLIETRGEGGYVLAPPSPAACHSSNRQYKLISGDLANIPTITLEERANLLDAARSFNQYIPADKIYKPKVENERSGQVNQGLRPGDDYNARGDWNLLLTSHGWTNIGGLDEVGHWRRPGKNDQGMSATTNYDGSNSLYVFSTNCAPFESEHSYSLFGAYGLLEHNGDFKAAAKALAGQGYGTPETEYTEHPKRQYSTGIGNAERLVALHGRDLRYCNNWKKWLIWNGQRWEIDQTEEIVRRAKDTVRAIYKEAGSLGDDDARRALTKWALQSESENRIREMVRLASAEAGIPIIHDELDADAWLLNVKNGTIDLRTGSLRPHSREDLITKLAPVAFDPSASYPIFESFLDKIMDGKTELIGFLKRAIGYSLTGSTQEQGLFLCYGSGANGKSTLLDLILDLLGDYAMQTATDTLMVKRGGSIPNDIARLKGARLVTAVETDEGRRMSESLMKQLTGGDRISARFMRAEWFEFKPTFKIWLATNHKPVIRGTDEAIWRRIRLIPFMVTIPEQQRDKTLPDKLRLELPGILRWAVEGCVEWQRHGLGVPDDVKSATEGYKAEMDVLGQWIADCCVVEPTAKAKAGDLYGSYKNWCEANGEYIIQQRIFGKHIKERGYKDGKSGDYRLWKGIGLLHTEKG